MTTWPFTLTSTLTEHDRALSNSFLSVYRHTHTHRGSNNESFTPCTWSNSCASLSSLVLPFYFLHFLTSLIFFLQFLNFVVNLHNSCNESMDSTDEFSLSTNYEPKAHDFYETSVEPYMQLLDSPPLFSDKVSSADPDYDDATLEDMLHQAHRAPAYLSPREDLSVSLSSSMSDRTGRPIGKRPGRPGEHRNSEAQIRTLLDKQEEQIRAECQTRINKHADHRRNLLKLGEIVDSQPEELHLARAEELQQRDQQLLQGQLLQQNLELREAHQRSLTEMEELWEFQSSTIDTIARRKLVEDQNTILELSGRILFRWKPIRTISGGVLELINRFEFEFRRRVNYIFWTIRIFGCVLSVVVVLLVLVVVEEEGEERGERRRRETNRIIWTKVSFKIAWKMVNLARVGQTLVEARGDTDVHIVR